MVRPTNKVYIRRCKKCNKRVETEHKYFKYCKECDKRKDNVKNFHLNVVVSITRPEMANNSTLS